MSGLQANVYNKMLESPDQFGAFKQPGIMCSNIVFPKEKMERLPKTRSNSNSINSLNSSNNSNNNSNQLTTRFNLREYIGDEGFANVAEKKRDGERTIFEVNQKRNIFLEENLKEYSAKIFRLIENVKKAKLYLFTHSL